MEARVEAPSLESPQLTKRNEAALLAAADGEEAVGDAEGVDEDGVELAELVGWLLVEAFDLDPPHP
jgi:hypothetical protein